MIQIKHDLVNPYAAYALNHFLFKYGISAKINETEKADIEIRCANSEKKDTCARILIQISSAVAQPTIRGHLKTEEEILPLFETPQKLKVDGKVVATFQSEGISYACAIAGSNRLTLGFDIFNEIGQILAGHLDAIFDKQDNESKMLMKIPLVDLFEEFLFHSLRPICQQNSIELENKPFWPDGKRFAVCLTHDVDRVYKTYQYLPSILKNIKKRNPRGIVEQIKSMLFDHGKNNPYWTFDKIMNLENKLGVKSTFFFLNETGKLNPFGLKSWVLFRGRYKIDSLDIVEIIRKLHSEGFEIGVHGSYYSYNNESLLRNEKARLEEILGDSVHGIRQHYLNFDPENTFKMQESVGFEYDTTLGFREGIGFRRGTCFPYHPFDFSSNGELPILEIPLLIMDGAIPGDKAILEQCIEIMDIVERSNGVLTLLWHQDRFSELDSPGWTELYKKLVIEAINRNAWITTPHELYRWLVHERESA